jgi:ABC-type transporter Mla subunit MlaD
MYAGLWRILPGPWWVRVLILLVLIAAVLYGLLFYAFPWVSQFVNPQEVTVTLPAASTLTSLS